MRSTIDQRRQRGRWGAHEWAALLLVATIAAALRLGTPIASLPQRFDEPWTRRPIEALIDAGWSVETAIDFEETKGPAFVWPYALWGELAGKELGRLRLLSVCFFVLGAVPLNALARRSGIARLGLVGVAGLYALLPQQAVLGQLLMSEAGFVAGSLAALLAFAWGFGERPSEQRRIAGPLIFGLLLAILLHSRIHAVALAAAVCVVATLREGRRSWPWWLACVGAELLRVPLWIRWGGLVSPLYRDMHQFAAESGAWIQLSNVTYLCAAMLPWTGVFLIAAWTRFRGGGPGRELWSGRPSDGVRSASFIILVSGALGLLLYFFGGVDLSERLPTPFVLSHRADEGMVRYLGLTASLVEMVSASPRIQQMLFAVMAGFGCMSLGILAALAFERRRADERFETDARLPAQLTVLTLVAGIAMYTLTRSFVLDRYLLPWAVLMPIVWWRLLPRWLLAVQAAGLAALMAVSVRSWLL